MSQVGRTRYFARSATRARSARRGEEKNILAIVSTSATCRRVGDIANNTTVNMMVLYNQFRYNIYARCSLWSLIFNEGFFYTLRKRSTNYNSPINMHTSRGYLHEDVNYDF